MLVLHSRAANEHSLRRRVTLFLAPLENFRKNPNNFKNFPNWKLAALLRKYYNNNPIINNRYEKEIIRRKGENKG